MLESARNFTESKMLEMREGLKKALANSDYKNDICIVVTGSYGRQEASNESDLDWYIIFDKDRDAETLKNEISLVDDLIRGLIPNQPGSTGTFGADAIVKFGEMQTNLGGDKDTNQNLTRRMLFLLEGSWLYNETLFKSYQEELLKKYIKASDSENNLPRFLLNDIIRYYRTITTDFEFKVTEKNQGWGLRNIKLKFSRKLLYFSGVLAVAELDNLAYAERMAKAIELFSLPPLERVKQITSDEQVFGKYQAFLEEISNADNRQELEAVSKDERYDSALYLKLNTLSQDFSKDLHALIKTRYPEDKHSLQHALVF